MNKHQLIQNNLGLVKAICVSLIVGVPTVAFSSTAMPITQVISQDPANPGSVIIPGDTLPSTRPLTPPLPEQQQAPSARVVPVEGKVNVRLVNQTYTEIKYQVIGDTEYRTLTGRSDVMLQNLKTPVNITFQRPDRGLLQVLPQSSEEGMLEVSLTETSNFGVDRTAMTIQENGNVLLN